MLQGRRCCRAEPRAGSHHLRGVLVEELVVFVVGVAEVAELLFEVGELLGEEAVRCLCQVLVLVLLQSLLQLRDRERCDSLADETHERASRVHSIGCKQAYSFQVLEQASVQRLLELALFQLSTPQAAAAAAARCVSNAYVKDNNKQTSVVSATCHVRKRRSVRKE